MKKTLISLFFLFISIASTNAVYVKRTSLNRTKHTPKPAYDGFGKPSKANGRIKTKSTRGYFKPSNGYKFVNPYSRSK